MISKFFIDRPILASVLAIIIVMAGLLALKFLPVAQFPEITPPTIQVSAVYPGANAETVAQTVGLPIEQQVNGVEGMMYMSSTSSSSGAYSLVITFEVGTDVDIAAVQVQNRVSIAQSSLPQPVIQQGVSVSKQSTNIVMLLSLTSTDSIYDGLYLSNYATLNLIDPLTRLPGVGLVSVFGAGDYSMRIWLDPEMMRLRGVTPQEVYQAIQSQNMEVSAGAVGQQLGSNQTPAFQYTLSVKGRLESVEEFGNIIINSKDGRFLRLRDIATIERGAVSYGAISNLNGHPTAALAIYQQSGANSMEVAKAVEEEMKVLANSFPNGVKYNVTLNTTDVIKDSIKEVAQTLALTVLLVIFVIFIFLQNWRAVIIPCITIPVSLIGTIAVMALFGFSINTLTLFGLILAVAIVVDDAIVVVENVTRKLDEDKLTQKEAVIESMREISGPIVGVVLVLLAVFLPTIFIGGISGQLYKQFAVTVAVATVISGVSALTFIPTLCALFLRKAEPSKFFLFTGFNRFFQKVQHLYEHIVEWLLDHALVALVSFMIFATVGIYAFMKWPTTFIPTEDDGYFMAVAQLPPAASLNRTVEIDKQINTLLAEFPEIESVVSIAGFSIMGGGEQSNVSTYFVILKPWSERKGKQAGAQAIVNKFNQMAYGIEGAQIFAIIPPAIPGLGASGGLQLQLEDTKNLGAFEMQKAVESILASYHSKPALAYLSSQYQANVPQYFLQIDRDKATFLGLDLSNVFATLSFNMGPAYVNDFVEFGHIYQVRLEANETAQEFAKDVLKLSVANSEGKMVPFSSFVSLKRTIGQDQIDRYNMYQTASINCEVMPGQSSGEAITQMEELISEQLQGRFGYEWTSVAYQEIESGNTTTIILMLALLVAFFVLAALYESWTSPIAAIIGLPIALLGAMLGCYVMGIPVSIYTQIGIILLIALSAKNGILIVEFARDFRAEGNSIRSSAYEAGSVRLRPILMTSFAFVLGVMPLLFATGAGAESRLALGASVVFGSAVNTLLATLFIPNFYEWMQKIQEFKFRSKKAKD